jgi:phosphate-selective porin OprO and OprP
MLNKIIFLVVLSIALGSSFQDIPKEHWSKDSVNRVISENIITGYEDNTYRGVNYINRYEMAIIISRILDFVEKTGHKPTTKEMFTIIENPDFTIKHEKGVLRLYSPKQGIEYYFDGRVFLDFGYVMNSENNIPSGAEARKARFAIKTLLYNNWEGEFDLSFDPPKEVKVQDFWIGYNVGNMLLKAGHHKPPVSAEKMTSSRFTTFMERSLPVDVFAISRRLGISIMDYNELFPTFLNDFFSSISWTYLAGVYFDELGFGSEKGYNESTMYAGRFAIKLEKDDLILLTGFSGHLADVPDDQGKLVELRTRGEYHHSKIRLLDTGDTVGSSLDRVLKQILGVYEISLQKGSFLAQAEFLNANYQRESTVNDAFFSGYYLAFSYILTGERRDYNPSRLRFDGLTPASQCGAWEATARFSHVNLNDALAGVYGGSANSWTFGLNWHANSSVKMMLNYILMDVDEHANGDGDLVGNDDHQTVAFRLQYIF